MRLENTALIDEAERHLAGCLLVDPHNTLTTIRGIVSAADFSNPLCRDIYATAVSLADSGEAVDIVIVQQRMNAGGKVFSAAEVSRLANLYTTTANAARHAEIVHEAAIQRKAEAAAVRLMDGDASLDETITELQSLRDDRAGGAMLSPGELVQRFADFVEAVQEGRKSFFLSTGYKAFDDLLGGGLVAGGLITIAARPGTGKTTAGLNIAERIAAAGKTVLYVSLEMPFEQLMARRAGIISGMSYGHILTRKLDDKELVRLIAAEERMSSEDFHIVDDPCSVDDVERHIRNCRGVSVVVIDHIGLLTNGRGGSRYEFMTAVTHRLKQIALSTGVPIIALCQLNRACEGRESKRPTMADLRDSGAIEEDSDTVALLFRQGMYLPDADKPKPWESQPLDFIVDKNRHGMQGVVTVNYCGVNARITEAR